MSYYDEVKDVVERVITIQKKVGISDEVFLKHGGVSKQKLNDLKAGERLTLEEMYGLLNFLEYAFQCFFEKESQKNC